MKSISTCSGLFEMSLSSCVSVSIFFGIRFKITSRSGRTRCRSASVFSNAKIRSESRMALAGRPLGILIGMVYIMQCTMPSGLETFTTRAELTYASLRL